MECPDCKTESIFMRLDGGKKEYYCTKCKVYYVIPIDPESIEFENTEIDDSDYESY